MVQIFRYERDGMECPGWLVLHVQPCGGLEGKGQRRSEEWGKELIAGRLERLKDEGTGRGVFEGCKQAPVSGKAFLLV